MIGDFVAGGVGVWGLGFGVWVLGVGVEGFAARERSGSSSFVRKKRHSSSDITCSFRNNKLPQPLRLSNNKLPQPLKLTPNCRAGGLAAGRGGRLCVSLNSRLESNKEERRRSLGVGMTEAARRRCTMVSFVFVRPGLRSRVSG